MGGVGIEIPFPQTFNYTSVCRSWWRACRSASLSPFRMFVISIPSYVVNLLSYSTVYFILPVSHIPISVGIPFTFTSLPLTKLFVFFCFRRLSDAHQLLWVVTSKPGQHVSYPIYYTLSEHKLLEFTDYTMRCVLWQWDWPEVIDLMKAVWKFFTTVSGETCVVTISLTRKHESAVRL